MTTRSRRRRWRVPQILWTTSIVSTAGFAVIAVQNDLAIVAYAIWAAALALFDAVAWAVLSHLDRHWRR